MFLCAANLLHAQDPYLTIKESMPLYFNPAYAGNEHYTRATLNYRNHYPTSGTSFATYSASFDMYIDDYNSGVGITLMSDQLGSKAYSYNTAGLYYSYKIVTGRENYVKAGLMANIFYGVNDPNGLSFPDMMNPDGSIDPNMYTYEKTTSFGADFGFGGLYVSKNFEVGGAVYHLGKANAKSYWNRPMRVYAHAEYTIPILSGPQYAPRRGISSYLNRSALKPTVFFINQGKIYLWGIGALYNFQDFKIGLYSRQNFEMNAVTASLQIGYTSELLNINYIYDMGFTGKNYRGLATSSHEIGITFKFSTGVEY